MAESVKSKKNRKNSHSKFSQTVTSKQWRSRKLSETVAGISANNAGSFARTHEIQTICRQCTDEMDCPICSVAHSSFPRWRDTVPILTCHGRTVSWKIGGVWRNSFCTSSRGRKRIWKSSTKICRQMEIWCVAGKERPHRRAPCPTERWSRVCAKCKTTRRKTAGQKRTSKQLWRPHRNRGR